jgi:hypothetical protein
VHDVLLCHAFLNSYLNEAPEAELLLHRHDDDDNDKDLNNSDASHVGGRPTGIIERGSFIVVNERQQ